MAELPHSLDASTRSGKGFGLDDHDLDDMFDDDEDELRGGGSDDAVAEAPSSRGARGARDDAEVGMSARHHSISLESPRSVPQESGPDAAIDEKGHLAEQHRMLSLQSQRAFMDLIYWKDAKATGAVFGGINIFFLLTLWLKYTVLTLLGEALLIAIGAAVLYHTASWVYAKVAKFTAIERLVASLEPGDRMETILRRIDFEHDLSPATSPSREGVFASIAAKVAKIELARAASKKSTERRQQKLKEPPLGERSSPRLEGKPEALVEATEASAAPPSKPASKKRPRKKASVGVQMKFDGAFPPRALHAIKATSA